MDDDIEIETASTFLGQTPVQLLETYIPGLSYLGPLVSSFLGFNFIQYVYNTIILGIFGLFTSSISISGREVLHDEVLKWLCENVIDAPGVVTTGARRLTAAKAKAWDRLAISSKNDGSDAYITSPAIKYEPASQSSIWFFHKWHAGPIFVRRQKLLFVDEHTRNQRNSTGADLSYGMVLTCVGWSTAPLKCFLDECCASATIPTVATTSFFKLDENSPYGKPRCVERPSRPLETVDLDNETKELLVQDIRRYVDPATVRFYARRGIPHRRGYLFHGPPGTGKTSMSLALAGHFNLDLYLLNLSDFKRGDAALALIFETLPQKCIVLLEDIDSAGVKRENIRKDAEKTKKSRRDEYDEDSDESDDEQRYETRSSVTLSGLLNAIDGVASQEGRILLMTTNDPEALDDALVRPGRIDMQVFFGPVSQKVAEQIFMRMYSKDPEEDDSSDSKTRATPPSPAPYLPTNPKAKVTRLLKKVTSLTLWTSLTTWSIFVTGPVYVLRFFFDDPMTPKKWLALTLAVTALQFFLKQLATCAQYALVDRIRSKPTKATVAAGLTSSFLESPVIKTPKPRKVSDATNNDLEQLHQMASTFGSKIPEGKFTPAEIQGFLIMNMESASAALAGIDAWVAKLLATKEQGKNIISDGVSDGQVPKTTTHREKVDQQAQGGDPSKQNVVYVTGSPTSVLFPSDAKGHKKLTAYFSYSPKGAPTTPEAKQKQKTTVDFFKNAEKAFKAVNGEGKQDPKPRKKVTGKKLNQFFFPVKSSSAKSAQRSRDITTSEDLPTPKLKGGGDPESGETEWGKSLRTEKWKGGAASEWSETDLSSEGTGGGSIKGSTGPADEKPFNYYNYGSDSDEDSI